MTAVWVTTYEKTKLVKRLNDFEFAVSPPIRRDQKATHIKISTREAILFLAIESQYDSDYPKVGDGC